MTMVIYLPELMGFENVNKVNRSVGSDSSNNGSNKIDPGNGLY